MISMAGILLPRRQRTEPRFEKAECTNWKRKPDQCPIEAHLGEDHYCCGKSNESDQDRKTCRCKPAYADATKTVLALCLTEKQLANRQSSFRTDGAVPVVHCGRGIRLTLKVARHSWTQRRWRDSNEAKIVPPHAVRRAPLVVGPANSGGD